MILHIYLVVCMHICVGGKALLILKTKQKLTLGGGGWRGEETFKS